MSGIADIESGEVLAAMTPDEARAMTERIRNSAQATWYLIERAYTEGAWRALGYASWNDYTAGEFRGIKLSLPREERKDVLKSMASAGMSQREIAAGTGLSKGTVSNALAPERPKMGTEPSDLSGSPEVADEEHVDDLPEDLPPTAVESADPPSVTHSEAVGPEPRSDSGPTLDQEPPATRLRDLGDPSDIWQADFAAEIVRVDRLFRRFPADEVAEMADADMYGSAEDLAKQVGRWFAEIELKRKGHGLRAIPGGRA